MNVLYTKVAFPLQTMVVYLLTNDEKQVYVKNSIIQSKACLCYILKLPSKSLNESAAEFMGFHEHTIQVNGLGRFWSRIQASCYSVKSTTEYFFDANSQRARRSRIREIWLPLPPSSNTLQISA